MSLRHLPSFSLFCREVVDCFVSLVDTDFDADLTGNTFKHLYLICNDTPIEKDKPNALVQTATSALAEIVPVPFVKSLVKELYPALFCTLLMRIGTAFGVDKGASSK